MISEPVTRNLVVPQGVDYPIRMRYLANGVPVNLSGATITGALRKTVDGPDIITFNSANGNVYLDGNNYFGINLVAEETSGIEPTKYLYNIRVVLSGGDTTRALEGTITLTPEIG